MDQWTNMDDLIIEQNIQENNGIKEIQITIQNNTLDNHRKLKACWSIEAEQDMKFWNIEEYSKVLQEQIIQELNQELNQEPIKAYQELFKAIEDSEIVDLLPVNDVVFLLNNSQYKNTEQLLSLIQIGKKIKGMME
jgi:hypothetical protein